MRRLKDLPLIFFITYSFFFLGCTSQQTVMQEDTSATESPKVNVEDYERAEQFLWQNTHDKILGNVSGETWTSNGKLIYNTRTADGTTYVMADPESGEKGVAFDHKKLAESLSEVTGSEINPQNLSLQYIELKNEQTLRYRINGDYYKTDLSTYNTQEVSPQTSYREIVSPDGKRAAYIKDYNLWMRNIETGEHTQLTTDGEEHYGYATNNAGWIRNDRPVLLWGPNSEKIATFQHDSRGVGEMYLYNTKVGHSELEKWKYPLPGDSTVFKIERVIVHASEENPKVVRLDMEPDYHRSTISDHIAGWSGRFLDNEWSADGSQLAFVSSSRNHQVAQLRVADAETGEVRDVLREEVETYFESGYSEESWRVLKKSNEVIWFSERDNWGHLYLYDLKTGELKHQITEGDWRVLDLEHLDEENRTIYFTGSNREEGNPYYHYLYKINMDGSGLQNLTPENKNHEISWSESNEYFVDTYSTPDTPPISLIRNLDGEIILELDKADISNLKEEGWVAPEQFSIKARDGETDLYGLMYKPTNFDSTKSYPVLNYLYPGPQSGSVGSRSFAPSRSDKQALAELGFIVVEVDAMGTPGRSKSFHDAYYGDMGDNGLPDQIAMIKQLGDRHPWMDLDRVGIWGHSGGGFASTRAILEYPDFYKVAVSGAGNHDNRNYEDDWGEKWHGLLKEKENVSEDELTLYEQGDNYDSQANQLLAKNLEGKLLIAHGMMDSNVPPTNTLLLVDALIKADKDFDMLVFPNAGHGFGNSRYFMNRRWDYFVKHLKGVKPSAEFNFGENIH